MVPTCHPDRPHQALGLCPQCYMQQYDEKRTRARKDPSEYAPNYRKPPVRTGRKPDCHPERKHVALGLCRACYQKDRPGRPRAECHTDRPAVADGKCASCYAKRRYHENPEEYQAKARQYGKEGRDRLRAEMLAAYGGRCACSKCPETNPAFLTLDHVGGGGKAHRAEVGSHSYRDLRRQGWPQDGYRLLCWNCNAMTRHGACPHELED